LSTLLVRRRGSAVSNQEAQAKRHKRGFILRDARHACSSG
jgi:hypothetical protein